MHRLASSVPVARRRIETPGDRRVAVLATTVAYGVNAQRIAGPLDDRLPTLRTVRALVGPVGDVARIDVPHAGTPGRFVGHDQRVGRRGTAIGQLEVGMERREMDRHVGPHLLDDPCTHPLDLIGRVVFLGNQQVGNFHPGVGMMGQPAERVEHRCEPPAGQSPIEVVAKRFQVDVRGVHVLVKGFPGVRLHVAGSDGDRFHTHRMTGSGRVDRIFGPDDRIVVGEGHATASELPGRFGDRFRLGHFAGRIDVARPRGVPILAEAAGQVAAGRTERENSRARIELVERFFFDRIDAESRAAAVGGRDDPTFAIFSDEAKPPVGRPQRTTSGANVANDSFAIVRFVPPAAGPRAVGKRFFIGR